jgi:hypothetical protein
MVRPVHAATLTTRESFIRHHGLWPGLVASAIAGNKAFAGSLNEIVKGRRIRGGTDNDQGPGTGRARPQTGAGLPWRRAGRRHDQAAAGVGGAVLSRLLHPGRRHPGRAGAYRCHRPLASRGDAEIFDVRTPTGTAPSAARRYASSPIEQLRQAVRLDWDAMGEWLEEDEPVYTHPRDPYTRVDILASSRHVRVEVDGVTVADSGQPLQQG